MCVLWWGIQLQIGLDVPVNLTLSVGGVTESVTVRRGGHRRSERGCRRPFNRVNLNPPSAPLLFRSDATRIAGAERITSLATPARQLQLGVKFLF